MDGATCSLHRTPKKHRRRCLLLSRPAPAAAHRRRLRRRRRRRWVPKSLTRRRRRGDQYLRPQSKRFRRLCRRRREKAPLCVGKRLFINKDGRRCGRSFAPSTPISFCFVKENAPRIDEERTSVDEFRPNFLFYFMFFFWLSQAVDGGRTLGCTDSYWLSSFLSTLNICGYFFFQSFFRVISSFYPSRVVPFIVFFLGFIYCKTVLHVWCTFCFSAFSSGGFRLIDFVSC